MQEGGTLTATVWYIFGDQSEMFRDQEARILKAALDQVAAPPADPMNAPASSSLDSHFNTRLGTGQT